jgi:hypothetical protein
MEKKMSVIKSLKTVLSTMSESDLSLFLAMAKRFGGNTETEDAEDNVVVPRPKKNKKNEEQPVKRGRGRPKKTEAEKAATAAAKAKAEKASNKPAKEKPAKTAASSDAEEFAFSSSVKKAERTALIAKITKIMDNENISANDLKEKYTKKGVEINFGRGRKGDAAKKKIILVAAANAGQKI